MDAEEPVEAVVDLRGAGLDLEVGLDALVDRLERGALLGDRDLLVVGVVALVGGGGFVDGTELALDLGAGLEVLAHDVDDRHVVSFWARRSARGLGGGWSGCQRPVRARRPVRGT
jgi:hypothetical protein